MTCNISRHAEANNRYIKDVNDNENYLLYINANNPYGWGMSENLPISSFGWCQINEDEIRSYDTISDIGYIVEVDLIVPNRRTFTTILMIIHQPPNTWG